MWRHLLLLGFLAFLLPLWASGADDKKTGGTSKKEDMLDADKLSPGRFSGKLLSLPAPNSSFNVEVPTNRLELKNPGQAVNPTVQKAFSAYTRDVQRVNQLQNQVQQATNPKAYQQAMQQLQNAMNQAEQALNNAMQAAQNPANSPYKVVTDKKTVEFHTGEQMVVRTLMLPLEYDDKGQPKKYSPEDVKKLKGPDPKMPGYEAKLEDLKTGTNVLITLGPTEASSTGKKDPEKKDPDKKEPEKKDADKPATPNADMTHRTVVTMILILNAEDHAATTRPDKKGKK